MNKWVEVEIEHFLQWETEDSVLITKNTNKHQIVQRTHVFKKTQGNKPKKTQRDSGASQS